MVIVVTGCCGFIGYHLSKRLLDDGHIVIGVDNINKYYDVNLKFSRLEILKEYNNFSFSYIDITNFEDFKVVFVDNDVDVVCNLAAQAGVRYSLEAPFEYQKNNIEGFQVVIELVRLFDIKTFIYASSSSVYGNITTMPLSENMCVNTPLSLYAATKVSNELVAYAYNNLFGINSIGLRYFTVYGPMGRPDMALFLFTDAINRGVPIDVYNYGKMKRSFTYIDDVVDGTVGAIHSGLCCEIVNIAGNESVSLLKYIECLEKCLGKKAIKNMMPLQLGDVVNTEADISKAKKLLNYKPSIDIEDGIKEFVRWYNIYYGGNSS